MCVGRVGFWEMGVKCLGLVLYVVCVVFVVVLVCCIWICNDVVDISRF